MKWFSPPLQTKIKYRKGDTLIVSGGARVAPEHGRRSLTRAVLRMFATSQWTILDKAVALAALPVHCTLKHAADPDFSGKYTL